MLGKKVLSEKISRLDELMLIEKQIKAEKESLENEVKGEMERRGVDVLEVGNRIVRWTPYTSQRFDSVGFRKANPDEYQMWVKEVKGHRFSVS